LETNFTIGLCGEGWYARDSKEHCHFWWIKCQDLGEKLISMGCDGNSVFGCSFQGFLHLGLKMP
jgi:hypothetical protein